MQPLTRRRRRARYTIIPDLLTDATRVLNEKVRWWWRCQNAQLRRRWLIERFRAKRERDGTTDVRRAAEITMPQAPK